MGSGIGPFTVAPVRLAVSTISRAELSMRRWSKAFNRMRMFWLVATSGTAFLYQSCITTGIVGIVVSQIARKQMTAPA
jgi:hypothetical protein